MSDFSESWDIETRQDSIGRPWVKCFYCQHWIPAWGNPLYHGQKIGTREEEQANLRAIIKYCRWCRKIVDKAVKMWKDGKFDEARFLAARKLSAENFIIFVERCKQ